MPTREQITTFTDVPPPAGASPWVSTGPSPLVDVVPYDDAWPRLFADLAGRLRGALGWRAIVVEHVGSTAVPGLPAKPVVDIDLTVADPADEAAYVPALEALGFELRVREPWWYEHRMLRLDDPLCHLHVFGFDSPELVKHRLFRDWLRGNPEDRDRYAQAKRAAAAASSAAGEHSMQYNARKEEVVREIYQRAFAAAGLR